LADERHADDDRYTSVTSSKKEGSKHTE
jgi:hypothetical protein